MIQRDFRYKRVRYNAAPLYVRNVRRIKFRIPGLVLSKSLFIPAEVSLSFLIQRQIERPNHDIDLVEVYGSGSGRRIRDVDAIIES